MCIFHKWSKWKLLESGYVVGSLNKRYFQQERICEKCGKIQRTTQRY